MEQPSDPDEHATEPQPVDPADLPQPAASGLTYAGDRTPAPDPDGRTADTTGGNGIPPGPAPIMATKEHKRFLEFADAVRRPP